MDIILLVIGVICVLQKRTAVAFTILFALFTNYYSLGGSGISETIVAHNVTDSGIVLFFFMLLHGQFQKRKHVYPILKNLTASIRIFAVLLFIIVLVDIIARGTDISSIIRTYRHWLVLCCAPALLNCYSIQTYKVTLRYVLYVTVVATVIILAEYYFNIGIIGRDSGQFINTQGTSYSRGYIPSSYAGIFLLILLTNYFAEIRLKWKYLLIGGFFLTYVNSMIRSWLLSIILGILMMLYKTGKMKLSNFGYAFAGVILLFSVVLSNDVLMQRVTSGISDVATIEVGKDIESEGNMTFRLALLTERADYILESFDTALLGVGGVREKDFPTKFSIGLYNEDTGRITQLDTGDIAWALLILRLGLLGLCLFLYMWITFIRTFNKTSSQLGTAGAVYLLISILIAFCSSEIAFGWFWLFYMLLMVVAAHGQPLQVQTKIR